VNDETWATPKNNCICQRAGDAVPSGRQAGRQVEPQKTQITQIERKSTTFQLCRQMRAGRCAYGWIEIRRDSTCLVCVICVICG
jgi:hypothetical protein